MNNWKGIAIAGIWIGTAAAIIAEPISAIVMGICAMIATMFVSGAN